MDKFLDCAKFLLSAGMAYLFGEFDRFMELLCIAMALDFITGLILALVFRKSTKTEQGCLNSGAAIKGVMRKVCQLLLVALITQLSEAVGDDAFCRNTAILFFTAGECISILENVALMGVQYPVWLKNGLEILRNSKK